jgi:hypothetical protein
MEEQNRGAPQAQGATILWGKSALPPDGNPYDGECSEESVWREIPAGDTSAGFAWSQ